MSQLTQYLSTYGICQYFDDFGLMNYPNNFSCHFSDHCSIEFFVKFIFAGGYIRVTLSVIKIKPIRLLYLSAPLLAPLPHNMVARIVTLVGVRYEN